MSLVSWHSDVSYELQPPGLTIFFMLELPKEGGDTQFASQVEVYRRFSPEFKKRLEGLRAVHSGVLQANNSRAKGGPVRREPIETEVCFLYPPRRACTLCQSTAYPLASRRPRTPRYGRKGSLCQ
jgi:alpha-ketoglutarate-dependent taurine dioxygenase